MNENHEYILFCLRVSSLDSAQAFFTQVTDQQWEDLTAIAEKLGVAPLLYSRLLRLGFRFPPNVDALLLTIIQNNTARNLNFLTEHNNLIKALEAQNIPVISLKGIYLATCIYQNMGERVIGDIDLLVPLDDLSRAVQVIESTGYRSNPKYDLEFEKKRLHHLPPYFKSKAPVLELHWNILARISHHIDLDGIWERSLPVKIGGSNARTLCPEDLLIHLCAHIASHLYRNATRSLYDIKLVLEHFETQLDWQIVSTRAREWGLINSVYLTLRLTRSLLDFDLPAPIWQTLHPGIFNEKLIDAAELKIFREETFSSTLTSAWKSENIIERLLGAWKRLALPPKILAGKYNLPPVSKLVYIYYLIRAKDLIILHGRDLMDLLQNNKRKGDMFSNDGLLIDFLDWHPDLQDTIN
jgi:hypothetical protein